MVEQHRDGFIYPFFITDFIVRLSLTKPIRIKLQTKPFRQAQHDKVFRDALKIVFDRLKLTNKLWRKNKK